MEFMRAGAHVSIAGSLDLAIDRAVEIGAQCIQIFGSAPQRWQFLLFPEEQIKAFKRKAREHKISPVFVHSIYLINLASENPYILNNSITSITQYLKFSKKIDAEGVIFHTGSHKGVGWEAVKEQVFQAIAEILKRTEEKSVILENSSGAGGIIGARFSELGEIIRAIKDLRIKVCLDTAHAFESGYNIREREGLDKALGEFDAEIGLDRLIVIHANDSKTRLASGLDRHENIGQGYIGESGFKIIINHPTLKDLPFIIETPGFEDRGVDRKNLKILRRLATSNVANG